MNRKDVSFEDVSSSRLLKSLIPFPRLCVQNVREGRRRTRTKTRTWIWKMKPGQILTLITALADPACN